MPRVMVQSCPITLPLAKLAKIVKVNYLVVHCAATPPTMDIGVKEINAMHLKRGFSCVGYHYVIRRDGTIEKGRPDNCTGAHVQGFNSTSLGVCMVGGITSTGASENNFTEAQFISLKFLLIDLKMSYPSADILGHRDLSPDKNKDGKITSNEWLKDCPCFDVRTWAKGLFLMPQVR